MVGTCKHLRADPFGYLRKALPGLFTLGEQPTAERRHHWLPDRGALHRTRTRPAPTVSAG
ncbi:MAG TPA: hypothetical protein VKD72_32235 [Gemmataceae bacterium]|nr:hypothetical protein [Gemmataceae bacterium]